MMSRTTLACALVLPLVACRVNLPLGPRDAGATSGGSTNGGSSSGTGSGSGGGTSGSFDGGPDGIFLLGQPCSGNIQCFSGICGVRGIGRCCGSKCDTADPMCGATGCDETGACIYPSPKRWCAGTCAGQVQTEWHCDGTGQCEDGGTVTECPWGCGDATGCRDGGLLPGSSCGADYECSSGVCGSDGAGTCCSARCDTNDPVCSATGCDPAGACIYPEPLGWRCARPGTPCKDNSQCTSGVCGASGTGNCCTAVCDSSDPICGASDCDSTGACNFPAAGVSCASETCIGASYAADRTCNGAGACEAPDPEVCPGNYRCDGLTKCYTRSTSCTVYRSCSKDSYCLVLRWDGRGPTDLCLPKRATGGCANRNDECTSGICLGGYCCSAACDTTDSQCGATGCDATTGDCVFPDVGAPCGACTSVSSGNLGTCDGTHTCGPKSDTDCGAGEICDTFKGVPSCCAGPGAVVYVDNATGLDGFCCGTSASPCRTLTRAMDLISHAKKTGLTINATVSGAGGDWTQEGAYPVTLGWGVTLSAPGVYFNDMYRSVDQRRLVHSAIFDVSAQIGDTTGYAVIEGTGAGANLIVIGADTNGNQLADTAAVTVEQGMTLYLGNAFVNSSSAYPWTNLYAVQVYPGAKLVLGQDAGGATGPVTIGGDLPGGQAGLSGQTGIYCIGVDGDSASVTDSLSGGLGFSSVLISNQAVADIDAEDFCTVDLESAPVLGTTPSGGFGTCTAKLDGTGLLVNGEATVTFGSASGPAKIECMQGRAIDLEPSRGGNGSPLVRLDHVTVQNADIGLVAADGTATVNDSTFRYNYLGVVQSNTGTIDLSGGGGAAPNTVICSSNLESFGGATNPGIDVWNQGTNSLAADYVTWDTSGPDYFSCDLQLTSCDCNLTTCAAAALADDMDAVEDSAALGGITTTHPSQSSAGCK